MAILRPQNEDSFHFKTKKSTSKFRVVKFNGKEAISDLFYFEIELVSKDTNINLEAILQDKASLTIQRGEETLKFQGALESFEQLGKGQKYVAYRAVLVPRLWLLSLNHQSRIFQRQTVPDIIEEVLRDANFEADEYELKVKKESYPEREYVVQYQETDLNFISRLMEHEGIFYFFSKDKLIISDNCSIHSPIPGDSEILYRPLSGLASNGKESVQVLVCRQRNIPGKVILQDYNWRKPSLNLKLEEGVVERGQGIFSEYGNHFKDTDEGARLAKVRSEEIKSRQRIFMGESDCRAFRPGFIFKLKDHYRRDFDTEYLPIEVQHFGSQSGDFLSGFPGEKGEEELVYRNEFVCIPADVQFRPERKTPKPRLYGVMNAKVDAAGSGEHAEIDDQGRYKVIVPFDASGKSGGKASPYIRMAQPYAGANYGMHFPLHKGTEVIWTCIDGDLDRPVICGTVPNLETMSPVTRENQTKSVIRTGGGNEIKMEDSDGSHFICLSTPKDKTFFRIGAHEGNGDSGLECRTEGKEHIYIGGNKYEVIKGDTTYEYHANTHTVIKGDTTEEFEGTKTSIVHGHTDETFVGTKTSYSRAVTDETFVGAKNSMNLAITNEMFAGVKVSNNLAATLENFLGLKVSACAAISFEKSEVKNILEAPVNEIKGTSAIKLTCGGSSITIEEGSITIKSDEIIVNGKKVDITGSSNVQVHSGGSKLKVTGSEILGSSSRIRWV